MIKWMSRKYFNKVAEIAKENHIDLSYDDIVDLLRKLTFNGIIECRKDDIIGFCIYELKKECIIVHYLVYRREFFMDEIINLLKEKIGPNKRQYISIPYNSYEIANELKMFGCSFKENQAIFGEING